MKSGATRERILEYALDTYGTEPDNPFSGNPEAVVLRHDIGRKWYGLIMRVSRQALGLGGEGFLDVRRPIPFLSTPFADRRATCPRIT